MRYQFIQAQRRDYPLTTLCRVMEVSVSGYYAWNKRPASQHSQGDEVLSERIRQIFVQHRHVYGSPRIHAVLRQQGMHCGRKRVARLMQQAGLAVVLDVFSRLVVGWAMAAQRDEQLVATAPRMAVARRQPHPGLIHHSDRGSQYASRSYQAQLAQAGMQVSMSRKGDCYDNAMMESFFGSFKAECVYQQSFQTRTQAQHATFEYIEVFYNRQRLHSALGYVSPVTYEHQQE